MRNKEDLFIDWICGKTNKFPLCQLKDKPQIPNPVILKSVFKRIKKLNKKIKI